MKTCAISVIKNEQKYLEEWIRYHLNLVDTLFIFEDYGSESHKNICSKFGDKVILKSVLELGNKEEIINKKNKGLFLQGYYFSNGIDYIHKNYDYDWCFILDSDEFLTPIEEFPTLLEKYTKYDGILLYWKNFGASGYIHTPPYDKPTWETFTKECGYTVEDWKHRNISKMCFNIKRFKKNFVFGGHTALCNWVRTDFKTSRQLHPTFDVMYIRHYMTKSWQEYKWKLEQRGDICPNHRKINDFFEMNEDMSNIKEELINGKQ